MDEIISFRNEKHIDHSLEVIMEDMSETMPGLPISRSVAIRYAIDLTANRIRRDRQLKEKEVSERES